MLNKLHLEHINIIRDFMITVLYYARTYTQSTYGNQDDNKCSRIINVFAYYCSKVSSDAFTSAKNVKKVQVGKDQEKAQSEKDSHSKTRGGKKTN